MEQEAEAKVPQQEEVADASKETTKEETTVEAHAAEKQKSDENPTLRMAPSMSSKQPDPPAPASTSAGDSGWGGWGGWWTATSSLVNSVTETATKAANQLADQLNTALLEDEDGDGVEGTKEKGKEKVNDDDDAEGEGLLDYLSTVLQQQVQGAEKSAASMLESTLASLNQFSLEQSVELGQKLTMQSLDMLEAVGKKTIETLELEEQIQQSISQHLAEQEVEQEMKNEAKTGPVPVVASPKPVRQKAITFESNFEDCYGKAHLEALEHLSASCLMIFYKANPQALKKLAGSLKRIEKLFNDDDDDDESEDEQELDIKLLRRLNRKARMKRKIIEKFVAAAKETAQQLVDEFNRALNKKEGEEPKTSQQLSEEALAQLSQTSKNAMLRLSELSAAAVELLLRVAESYLVGVTAPVAPAPDAQDTETDESDMDHHEDTDKDAPSEQEDDETPALLVSLLAKSLSRSIEEVIQSFVNSANSIAKAAKAALQPEDSAKFSAEIDKKVKAIKKEVESKHGSSAQENLQEAKKMFLNISKAVLVNPSVIAASPSPASPSVLPPQKLPEAEAPKDN